MAATTSHLLIDADGDEIRVVSFGPGVFWKPGETIILGAMESYRVLERRDSEEPITLVVERTQTETT